MNTGGLRGVRVLDFTQVWAGPYCSMLLAFNGAEVIKVESEKRPDRTRFFSVTLATTYKGKEESQLFNNLNLNKLDITLNLSHPQGVELAKDIAKLCDVVVENFRPGVMARLGLDYEALRQVRPDIVYLSSSSRGSKGPEWNYAGYAPTFAALSGLSHLTGHRNGTPSLMSGRTDLLVGTIAFLAIMAALIYRSRTGKGQYIDLSSSEAISVLIGDAFMDYAMNGREQIRNGNRDPAMAPHNCYRCQGEDKWISIAVASDEEWQSFCDVIGKPEWARDERFADALSRKANEDELDRLISEWALNHTHYEAMELLQGAGVAAMPSFSSEELFNNPHLKERRVYTEVDHPVLGKQTLVGTPWKLSATPAAVTRHAPLFGEHNKYVFGELLGMPAERLDQLQKEHIVY